MMKNNMEKQVLPPHFLQLIGNKMNQLWLKMGRQHSHCQGVAS